MATISGKVLIIDDSETVRSHLSSLVMRHGVAVATAADGREGLAQLESPTDFGLVFVDVTMPHLDGIAMVEAVSEAFKKQGRTLPPIIMVTTESSRTIASRARQAGARGWIVKPCTEDVIDSLVVKFLKPAS